MNDYITSIAYVADGVLSIYSIPFEYEQASQIKVRVDGVDLEAGFTVDERGVVFDTVPEKDARIYIYRQSDYETRRVDFQQHTALREKDLDLSYMANWHLIQELYDKLQNALMLDPSTDTWDMRFKRIVNLAQGVEDNDAVNLVQMREAISDFEKLVKRLEEIVEEYKEHFDEQVELMDRRTRTRAATTTALTQNITITEANKMFYDRLFLTIAEPTTALDITTEVTDFELNFVSPYNARDFSVSIQGAEVMPDVLENNLLPAGTNLSLLFHNGQCHVVGI